MTESHPPSKTTKHSEAAAENSSSSTSEAPPSYTPSTPLPPAYDSIRAALSSLSQGDPQDTISVPMVSRTVSNSIHNFNPFSHKEGKVVQSIVVRQMTRAMYLKHYAKDPEGNFVGTAAPAPDAGLVFVPGKGTTEDMWRQAESVALERQELRGKGIGKFGMSIQKK
ncbi:hypothetical protein EJ02DRAFT_458792 [Clathrospora elynae]|uniref:Uncharacterized protein n=1 Tax=Clathrospora elynae TaxID=706981 RepID=A0A6A5SFV5_9PLEO|nr:hypothetical protein EJ02DRAFT_458792 [Clathrospora elynae]